MGDYYVWNKDEKNILMMILNCLDYFNLTNGFWEKNKYVLKELMMMIFTKKYNLSSKTLNLKKFLNQLKA